ncbi:MAG TPA: hypothetical protein V6D08_19515 [Candidatus Obscuribacterales bacterium]
MVGFSLSTALRSIAGSFRRIFYKAYAPEAMEEMKRLEHMLELEHAHQAEQPEGHHHADILNHFHRTRYADRLLGDAEHAAHEHWWHAAGDSSREKSDPPAPEVSDRGEFWSDSGD